jgi:hypothetical protein
MKIPLKQVWALTTTTFDVQVRDLLYKDVSTNEATNVLAETFQSGTASEFGEQLAAVCNTSFDKSDSVQKLIAEIILYNHFPRYRMKKILISRIKSFAVILLTAVTSFILAIMYIDKSVLGL